MCACYVGPLRSATAGAASVASSMVVEAKTEAFGKLLKDLSSLPEDLHSKEFSQRFSLAVYEYLMNETDENISEQMSAIVIAGTVAVKNEPVMVSRLKSLGSEKWGELEPWEKLQILTSWHKDTDTYERTPTQRQKDVRYPVSTLLSVAKEVGVKEAIPANRVSEEIIASQYPLVSNGSAELILRAACENNAVIFDLTQQGEIFPSDIYYPENLGETIEIGENKETSIFITYVKNEEDGAKVYEVRDSLTGKTHSLRRFQSEDWKDREAPSCEILKALVAQMEKYPGQQKLVHCRAGVGRTGTLLGCYLLAQKIARGEIDVAHMESEVIRTISRIRQTRGPSCVQNEDQLKAVLEFAGSHIAERNTARREVAMGGVPAPLVAITEASEDANILETPKPTFQIEIRYDTGIGNSLELRGTGAGMGDWEIRYPLTWSEGNVWKVDLPAGVKPEEFKILLVRKTGTSEETTIWEDGANRIFDPTLVHYSIPRFSSDAAASVAGVKVRRRDIIGSLSNESPRCLMHKRLEMSPTHAIRC